MKTQPRSQGLSSLPPLSFSQRQWRQRRETLGTRLMKTVSWSFSSAFLGKSLKHLMLILGERIAFNTRKVSILKGFVKDGAYYCYCAYVLRISRYSDFLSPMLTNTGIFLHGLKLSGESRS